MRSICFIALLLLSCRAIANTSYTGSTPADIAVRQFLGIPLTDSIEFIRWKLSLNGSSYQLSCNYGLSKPNTNGFINGGRQLAFDGQITREKNFYVLQHGNKKLRLLPLDNNLLHIAGEDGVLLVGNDGWNYTLSSEKPVASSSGLPSVTLAIKDSVKYVGRTPCLPYESKRQSPNCYKLKWVLVLYANKKTGLPSGFHINSTLNRKDSKPGTCSVIKNKNGDLIYHLQYDEENFYLKAVNAELLVFTDKQGDLLVGNEDFSFTLNKK
jgi:hypothetical protein